jgi:hypothetical protein
MVALPAIALGMAAVTHGQLAPLDRMMRTRVIEASDGGAVTVATMTGLPFWALALLFAVATLIAGGVFKLTRKKKGMALQSVGAIEGAGARILTARSWKPWQAGIAIGILGAFAFLSSTASGRNQPLGVAYGVYFTQVLITDMQVKHVWKPGQAPEMPPAMTPPDMAAAKKMGQPPFGPPREKPVSWWLVLLVISLVAGAQAAARLSGEAKLYPKPPEQMIIAFAGGLLIGLGAGIAQGCMVCNILSGWAMMSAGAVLFGVTAVLASWATTYFYLMGGSLFRARE